MRTLPDRVLALTTTTTGARAIRHQLLATPTTNAPTFRSRGAPAPHVPLANAIAEQKAPASSPLNHL